MSISGQPRADPPRGLRVGDRGALWVLLGAMMASAATLLRLSRGSTLFSDELRMFGASARVDFPEWIEPWNGHLQITSRVIYKTLFETFGANYLAVRALNVFMVLVAAGVFFALVRRRVGAVAALAPTLLLLFLGSSWTILLSGFGTTATFTIATGLAALLAIERDDVRGDVAACVLITLSVASFSIGLAFLTGLIVAVLLRPTRWRAAWVFLIPLTLYVAWWVWARQFHDDLSSGANALLVPFWILESIAADAGSLLGVNLQVHLRTAQNLDTTTWARAAAIAFLIALALRVRQGGLPRSFWVSVCAGILDPHRLRRQCRGGSSSGISPIHLSRRRRAPPCRHRRASRRCALVTSARRALRCHGLRSDRKRRAAARGG